ncbi:hypothetical protein B0I35DRAFT_485063 [Stachybotrys elegans]|uniref:Uncharacterized protein n=1 Tax=Stachybotrys elegans TaxID=80388 RepID=A0A8K0SGR5_9HYPO|nr:hypothetical protein B0I35DRAFT_485063 [Stachybotrys elegans]
MESRWAGLLIAAALTCLVHAARLWRVYPSIKALGASQAASSPRSHSPYGRIKEWWAELLRELLLSDRILLASFAAGVVVEPSLLASAAVLFDEDGDQGPAVWCLLAAMSIGMLLSLVFLVCAAHAVIGIANRRQNVEVWHASKSCNISRWFQREYVWYSIASCQASIALTGIAVVAAAVQSSLTTVEQLTSLPFLCVWAAPLPAYLGYALIAIHAVHHTTNHPTPINRYRYWSWAIAGLGTFLGCLAVLLAAAFHSGSAKLNLASYYMQYAAWTLLLLENKIWRWLIRSVTQNPQYADMLLLSLEERSDGAGGGQDHGMVDLEGGAEGSVSGTLPAKMGS